MDWVWLMLAGVMEWGWPVGLKLLQSVNGLKWWAAAVLVLASIAGSAAFMWMAQRTIPMGTVYAVWTGIGAFGAFVLGIMFFGESAHPIRVFFVSLIVLGVAGLKLFAK